MIIIVVISFVLFSNDVEAIVKCDVNKKSKVDKRTKYVYIMCTAKFVGSVAHDMKPYITKDMFFVPRTAKREEVNNV